jgi:hypothetical protein
MNTITANELKTHLYIVADGMEGRWFCRTKEQELTLSINIKNGISFPKAASSFYQKSLLHFVAEMRIYPIENIWAFIEGSEK